MTRQGSQQAAALWVQLFVQLMSGRATDYQQAKLSLCASMKAEILNKVASTRKAALGKSVGHCRDKATARVGDNRNFEPVRVAE